MSKEKEEVAKTVVIEGSMPELIPNDDVVLEELSKLTQGGEPKIVNGPQEEVKRPLSFGDKLVGITFNPGGNPDVDKAKALCAELADLVADAAFKNGMSGTPLFNHAIGEILNAQMNSVKLITFNPR